MSECNADIRQYLFTRLHQAGVKSVHGVPGDYNLVALDYIPKVGMNWVGDCNELNAGKRPLRRSTPRLMTARLLR